MSIDHATAKDLANDILSSSSDNWLATEETLARAYLDLAAQLEAANVAIKNFEVHQEINYEKWEKERRTARADLEAARSHIHEMEITVPHSTIIGLRSELEAARKRIEELEQKNG